MNHFIIERDNIDVQVIINHKSHDYERFIIELIEELDDDQFASLIEKNRVEYDKNIIFVNDLIKYYIYEGEVGVCMDKTASCICGVHIKYLYSITHKKSLKTLIIGKICADNFYGKKVTESNLYRCIYCNRRKLNGKNCINCKEKSEKKEILRAFFNELLNPLKEKFELRRKYDRCKGYQLKFGKYKSQNLEQIFKQNPSYITNFLMDPNKFPNKSFDLASSLSGFIGYINYQNLKQNK